MMLRRISLSASTSMAARRMSSSVLSNLSDMGLSEDQESYRDLARGFSEKELAPYAAEWDRNSHFPIPTLRKAAELGFAAMNCSPEHGGTGLGRRDSAVVVEELAAGCTSTAAYLTIHNMCAWMVDTFGTEEQRAAWIPRFASMDILASYCLTEPGSGSDAASLQTKAVRPERWIILR
jgi:alkylation response protein AidB-like acyl-CoA dehydrogenase